MHPTRKEIGKIATYHARIQTRARITNVRNDLNSRNFVAPSTGKPFSKGRGIFSSVSAAWRDHTAIGDHTTAQNIADWIADDNGNLVHLNY